MRPETGITLLAVGLLLTLTFAQAATTATTLFRFDVPTTRSISVAYGGSCSATNFFFNEIDANYDPDIDGNAAKVKPAGLRNIGTYVATDYNFVGVTNPSSTNVAYGGFAAGLPPANTAAPGTQLPDANYVMISLADGSSDYELGGVANRPPAMKTQFRVIPHPETVRDLNFVFIGQSKRGNGCADDDGFDSDMNGYIWNYRTGAYQRIFTYDATSVLSETDPIPQTIETIIDENITDFIASDTNITILVQGQNPNGTDLQCLMTDSVKLIIRHLTIQTQYCQSQTAAPITLTNNGNTTVNVDGNFASAFAGVDLNLVLKVWMGTGSGCGDTGFGGWEKDCSITGTTSPVTQTQCKNYNEYNETTGSRLVTSLAAGDSNQLCFSGDFNAWVSGGDHNQNFQAGVLFS